ncbi:hypothetical protein [Nocardia sp. NPDC060259]|uniref:hypothetical protein n=1 Tax=Nocardia sp. NPDC060259 TaxID=3347088 RepID=UPI00365D4BA2
MSSPDGSVHVSTPSGSQRPVREDVFTEEMHEDQWEHPVAGEAVNGEAAEVDESIWEVAGFASEFEESEAPEPSRYSREFLGARSAYLGEADPLGGEVSDESDWLIEDSASEWAEAVSEAEIENYRPVRRDPDEAAPGCARCGKPHRKRSSAVPADVVAFVRRYRPPAQTSQARSRIPWLVTLGQGASLAREVAIAGYATAPKYASTLTGS